MDTTAVGLGPAATTVRPVPLAGRALRKAWAEPRTHAGLGEVMVRYLNGELAESPGYLGPTNPETDLIRDDLIALNRAGLVTTQSQPGEDSHEEDGYQWDQRAFVEGYCDRSTARRLAMWLAWQHDVEWRIANVSDFRRWWQRGPRSADAVTLCDGEPVTAIPHGRLPRGEFDLEWRWISADAWDALQSGCHVVALDGYWGNRRVLWDTLRDALEVPR